MKNDLFHFTTCIENLKMTFFILNISCKIIKLNSFLTWFKLDFNALEAFLIH